MQVAQESWVFVFFSWEVLKMRLDEHQSVNWFQCNQFPTHWLWLTAMYRLSFPSREGYIWKILLKHQIHANSWLWILPENSMWVFHSEHFQSAFFRRYSYTEEQHFMPVGPRNSWSLDNPSFQQGWIELSNIVYLFDCLLSPLYLKTNILDSLEYQKLYKTVTNTVD